MIQIDIADDEKLLLRDYFKTSPIGLIRHKAQAIIMRSQGMFILEIAEALFVSERTVERWIKDFSQRRMASIFSGRIGNKYAAKLTGEQKKEIKKILGQKPSVYGLSKEFLNQKTFQCHIVEIAWGRLTEIIRAIGAFIKLYPNKKICIIWDNATCHKGILMREALAKGGLLERVHLVNLPPYAPDHNPIEHVWNTVKYKLANNQDRDFEETKRKFMTLTNNQFFPYQI